MGFVAKIFGLGAPEPDKNIGKAALENAALGKEYLEWQKQQYEEMAPYREEFMALAKETTQTQNKLAQINAEAAQEDRDFRNEVFRPLEQKMVKDAENYDTPERRAAAAANAIETSRDQYDHAASQLNRTASQMGIDPSSGSYAAQKRILAAQGAASGASSANQAVTNVELQGHARKSDAVNLGRNIASSQASSTGVALNAGNSALNAAGSPMQQAAMGAGMMGQGYSMAMNGNNSAMNGLLGLHGAEMKTFGANMSTLSDLTKAAGYAWGKM